MCGCSTVPVFFFSFFLYCTNIYLQLNRLRVRATTITTTTSVVPNDEKRGSSRASAGGMFFLFFILFYCTDVYLQLNDYVVLGYEPLPSPPLPYLP